MGGEWSGGEWGVGGSEGRKGIKRREKWDSGVVILRYVLCC